MARCLIVAEAGINHSGVLTHAMRLADAAKGAGADIVKYQTFDSDILLRPNDPAREELSELELNYSEFKILAQHCAKLDIEFMSTPGDVKSLRFIVEELGVKRIKIGSDDLTNGKLLKSAAATDLPIILSTGMATLPEIDAALLVIYSSRPNPRMSTLGVTLLHCVSLYPCPPDCANVGAIAEMAKAFAMPIGYSDHVPSEDACVMAVALGAAVIEAHLKLAGEEPIDNAVSFSPLSFKVLVERIRNAEVLRGHGRKQPCTEEMAVRAYLRKDTDGFRGAA